MPLPSNALAFATMTDLAAGLRQKQYSCAELAEYFLHRLETIGPRFNAVVTVLRDAALTEARRLDHELARGRDRGPLHGIPYGAKDLLAVKGVPTTWGAAPFRNRVIDEDATVIARLRAAGAVLAAKLSLVEIAGGLGYRQANASFTGPGLNPWDATRWSGGSSSGSGAAVAAGIVPFALGSETWGSILTPAGYCGATGLRPTYGLVSRHGAMSLSWTFDKIGPICRTAHDAGLVLAAIAGVDPADETTVDRPFKQTVDADAAAPFRLAVLREAQRRLQPEVEANFLGSLQVLREFASIEEVELPDFPYAAVAGTIISAEMSAAFEGLLVSGQIWQMTAPEDRLGAFAPQFIPAKDYINAFRIRRLMQPALDRLFARFDAVVTPTLATVAPPISTDFQTYQAGYRGSRIGGAGNAAGLPAITVPNGTGEAGLPTGIQFVGRAFAEASLIAVAQRYQRATAWHMQHPEL
jgi:aspartyl-tRNA(Asn)/glutamyl-tRNA(Gln) amidotransferase subunit A